MAEISWKSDEEVTAKEKKEQQESERASLQEKAQKRVIEKITTDYLLSGELPPEEKALFVALYEVWKPDEDYLAGDKINHEGVVFEVVQSHTSQSDWEPQKVPALFKKVYQTETSGGEEVVPDFVQPTGAHDAYKTGDKVLFEDNIYESLIDGNTWTPTGYAQGWKKLS